MTSQTPPSVPPPPPAPPVRPSGGPTALRIVGIVLLAGVVLCGLCGSALLALELLLPLMGA